MQMSKIDTLSTETFVNKYFQELREFYFKFSEVYLAKYLILVNRESSCLPSTKIVFIRKSLDHKTFCSYGFATISLSGVLLICLL